MAYILTTKKVMAIGWMQKLPVNNEDQAYFGIGNIIAWVFWYWLQSCFGSVLNTLMYYWIDLIVVLILSFVCVTNITSKTFCCCIFEYLNNTPWKWCYHIEQNMYTNGLVHMDAVSAWQTYWSYKNLVLSHWNIINIIYIVAITLQSCFQVKNHWYIYPPAVITAQMIYFYTYLLIVIYFYVPFAECEG